MKISPSLTYRSDGIGKPNCDDCGEGLTTEERFYYEHRCEACEIKSLERFKAWRKGADDPELDALYDGPKRQQKAH